MGSTHRLVRALAAAFALASSFAFAAPSLVKPYTGEIPKAEKRAFKSEPFRVQFDLAALKDLAPGATVDFTAPNGKVHTIIFDRTEDVGGGNTNWYGYYNGHKGTFSVVITKGPDATFGRIATPEGEYSFAPVFGSDYQFLLDMNVEKPYANHEALGNDSFTAPAFAVEAAAAAASAPQAKAANGSAIQASQATWTTCTPAAKCTIDLMVIWTPVLRTQMGSAAAVQTRIATMVAGANQAYIDSGIGIKLRLVNSQEWASYTFDNTLGTNEPSQGLTKITPASFNTGFDAVTFGGLENIRTNTYGADMVMILEGGPQFSGAGVAWVPNRAALTPSAFNQTLMYSSISGCWGFDCSYVFTHELGHNMGNNHDRATATYDGDGTIDPTSGSYAYSYGYYHCVPNALNCDVIGNYAACAAVGVANCSTNATTTNFAEIMAYFHASTTRVMKFSSPLFNCSGSNPNASGSTAVCGDANTADAARTINNNAAALGNMKTTVIPEGGTADATIQLGSNLNPSNPGDTVVFTVNLNGGSGIPGGSVTFLDGGAAIANCSNRTLTGGSTNCTTAFGASGTHSITAVYSGDPTYAGKTSTALNQVVNILPVVTVSSSANPSIFGANVTLTASLTGGVNAGTVLFRANGNIISGCSAVTVSGGGSASCTTSTIPVGANTIVAFYSGAAGFVASNSANFTQYIIANTSMTVTASISPAVQGAPITFTGTVASTGGTPTGTMSFFFDNGAACTGVAMTGLSASCTVSSNAITTHVMAAQYNGSTFFNPSANALAVPVISAKKKVVDFDQSGRAAILWQKATGRTAMWLMNGPTQVGGREFFGDGTGWAPILVGDLNGDGYADIVYERSSDKAVAVWLMNGATQIGGALLLNSQTPGAAWHPKFVADFNGDGKADIVWEKDDGAIAIWLMDGTTMIGGGVILPAGYHYHVKATADFNGDGKADLLWEAEDGSSALWIMNGATQVGGGRLFAGGSGWYSVAAADLNGDGMADIIWRHTDGRSATWIMNGSTQVGGALLIGTAGTGWLPVLAGDINGDGRADIVFAKTDGTVSWWAMNGVTQIGGGSIFAAGTGFTTKRLVDFNGDGRADVLAVKTNGDTVMGVFNGTTFDQTTVLAGSFGYVPIVVPE